MTDINTDTLRALWNETAESTWDSLYLALDEIYAREVVDFDTYSAIKWAIGKLVSNENEFPDSVGELASLLDPYM